MTQEQMQQTVSLIARAYPKQYANMTPQEKWEVVALYYDFFKDIPLAVMQNVVKKYIANNHFPPAIADLNEMVKSVMSSEEEATIESCIAESWKAVCGNRKFDELSKPSQVYWGSQLAIDAVGQSEGVEYTIVRGQMQKRLPDIIKLLKSKREADDIRQALTTGGLDLAELPIDFDADGKIIKA